MRSGPLRTRAEGDLGRQWTLPAVDSAVGYSSIRRWSGLGLHAESCCCPVGGVGADQLAEQEKTVDEAMAGSAQGQENLADEVILGGEVANDHAVGDGEVLCFATERQLAQSRSIVWATVPGASIGAIDEVQEPKVVDPFIVLEDTNQPEVWRFGLVAATIEPMEARKASGSVGG